jgi:hypothetical protein
MTARLALAGIAAALASAAFYAALRVGQALVGNEPDPALIIWSPHAGFFWRAWTAAYFGVMAGFVVFVVAARTLALDRVARALSVAVVVVALLVAAQGLFVP